MAPVKAAVLIMINDIPPSSHFSWPQWVVARLRKNNVPTHPAALTDHLWIKGHREGKEAELFQGLRPS